MATDAQRAYHRGYEMCGTCEVWETAGVRAEVYSADPADQVEFIKGWNAKQRELDEAVASKCGICGEAGGSHTLSCPVRWAAA